MPQTRSLRENFEAIAEILPVARTATSVGLAGKEEIAANDGFKGAAVQANKEKASEVRVLDVENEVKLEETQADCEYCDNGSNQTEDVHIGLSSGIILLEKDQLEVIHMETAMLCRETSDSLTEAIKYDSQPVHSSETLELDDIELQESESGEQGVVDESRNESLACETAAETGNIGSKDEITGDSDGPEIDMEQKKTSRNAQNCYDKYLKEKSPENADVCLTENQANAASSEEVPAASASCSTDASMAATYSALSSHKNAMEPGAVCLQHGTPSAEYEPSEVSKTAALLTPQTVSQPEETECKTPVACAFDQAVAPPTVVAPAIPFIISPTFAPVILPQVPQYHLPLNASPGFQNIPYVHPTSARMVQFCPVAGAHLPMRMTSTQNMHHAALPHAYRIPTFPSHPWNLLAPALSLSAPCYFASSFIRGRMSSCLQAVSSFPVIPSQQTLMFSQPYQMPTPSQPQSSTMLKFCAKQADCKPEQSEMDQTSSSHSTLEQAAELHQTKNRNPNWKQMFNQQEKYVAICFGGNQKVLIPNPAIEIDLEENEKVFKQRTQGEIERRKRYKQRRKQRQLEEKVQGCLETAPKINEAVTSEQRGDNGMNDENNSNATSI